MQASNNNHTSVTLLVTVYISSLLQKGWQCTELLRQVFTLLKELSCY